MPSVSNTGVPPTERRRSARTAVSPGLSSSNQRLPSVAPCCVGSRGTTISGRRPAAQLALRGIEDLGGGLKARFTLLSGIASDMGSAASSTRFWNIGWGRSISAPAAALLNIRLRGC
jgi:hypothetical protein